MRIEVRTCIKCGEEKEIPQKFKHATNTCLDCQRKWQREYQRAEAKRDGRRVGTTGRVPYPLPEGYKTTGNLFKVMSTKTFRCKTKEEWRALMKERLNAVFENEELCRWIFAHNKEEQTKKQKRIEKDYPDIRYMTWEEWEKGLGDNEVDS